MPEHESKRPGPGHPSPYNPDIHPQQVEALMQRGLTRSMAARQLNICVDTFREWDKKHQEFSEALKRGVDFADAAVVEALKMSATGFDKGDTYFPPNVTSMCFWLKNRRPDEFRDRREVSAEIKITDLTEEEIETKIAALLSDDGVT